MGEMVYLTSVGSRTEAELLIAKLGTFELAAYLTTDHTHTFEPITPVDVYVDGSRIEEAREIIANAPILVTDEPDEVSIALRKRKYRAGLLMLAVFIGIPFVSVVAVVLAERL